MRFKDLTTGIPGLNPDLEELGKEVRSSLDDIIEEYKNYIQKVAEKINKQSQELSGIGRTMIKSEADVTFLILNLMLFSHTIEMLSEPPKMIEDALSEIDKRRYEENAKTEFDI